MTYRGLNTEGRPDKRASSLYHLGMAVTHEAKMLEVIDGLRPDQNQALNIFIGAVKAEHTRIMKELGYNV